MNNPHFTNGPPIQFAKIPNNWLGHLFLWALRRWLNKARYSIQTRGRKPRRGYKTPRYAHDLPKAHAKQLGVYITDKWEKKARAWKWHEEARERMLAQAKKEKALQITKRLMAGLGPRSN